MTPNFYRLYELMVAAHIEVVDAPPLPMPGCYIWFDDRERIGYVGASEDVKRRTDYEWRKAKGGALFPLAMGIRTHGLTPLGLYLQGYSPRLAQARLARERAYLGTSFVPSAQDVPPHDWLSPADLEEFMVRALGFTGFPPPFNSQYGSAWHRSGDSAIESLAFASAQACLRHIAWQGLNLDFEPELQAHDDRDQEQDPEDEPDQDLQD